MRQALPRFNQSGLLFMPHHWQRNAVLRWLKRIHAWTGFWGALLFLMMGTSGFLLNHRAVLKIETGKPVEVDRIEIAVRPGAIPDADALGKWAKQALHLPGEGRAPQREGGPGGGGPKTFMDRRLPEAELWSSAFNLPDQRVTVEYVPGANHVTARREAVGFFGFIKNLHKGVGLGMLWVLFLDTIAGALIAMSLTGFLLWTRLHGNRLLAGAILLGSLALAAAAIGPFV